MRRLQEVYNSWRRIFVQTMNARRTFRFFNETGIANAIMKPACPWGDGWRLHFAVSKGFIIGCEKERERKREKEERRPERARDVVGWGV